MSDQLQMREARAHDTRQLFEWVNAPDSLANKEKTTGAIEWPDHQRWCRERLDDAETHIFILEANSVPVGQIRMERGNEGIEIDVYIVPAARGKGYARHAIRDALEKVPVRPVIARVRDTNQASKRLFSAVGFECSDRDGDMIVFSCLI